MNDEQIIEYLRSRAQVEPPPGLAHAVIAGIDSAPAPRSRFATLLPVVASAVIVVVAVAAALFVTRVPGGVGSSSAPTESGAPSSAPSASPPLASPSPSPAPTGTSSLMPSPADGYVFVDGLPITVLRSEEADALFSEVETCVSEAGYTVAYPASWYTNAVAGDTPACSWFAPEPFDGAIRPAAVSPPPPDGVWLSMGVVDGSVGYTGITPIYMNEPVMIGGRDGHRAEFGPSTLDEATSRPEYRGYHYVIPFADEGPTFAAGTNSDLADDYPLAKAVLDRIMASVRFGGT